MVSAQLKLHWNKKVKRIPFRVDEFFFVSAVAQYMKQNSETFRQQAESMQNTASSETAKTFHGCLRVFCYSIFFQVCDGFLLLFYFSSVPSVWAP